MHKLHVDLFGAIYIELSYHFRVHKHYKNDVKAYNVTTISVKM